MTSAQRRLCFAVAAVSLLTCCFLLLSWPASVGTGSRHLVSSLLYREEPALKGEDIWPPRPQPNLTDGTAALVLVHIQKTGGSSLDRQLVRSGVRGLPCQCQRRRKRCRCLSPAGVDWLLSRGTAGWACGLHASLAAMRACAPSWRRFKPTVRLHYITVLRRPVDRFLSEWRHVRRGATWSASRRFCDGRPMQPQPEPCYAGADWQDVGLAEFAGCERNPARNRQTRMLADLAGPECLGSEPMLAGALANLRRLAFFGLTEYQVLNQYQLTRGLGLLFNRLFWQHDATVAGQINITLGDRVQVESATRLDAKLYAHAEALFFDRTRRLLLEDAIVADADPGLAGAIAGLDTDGLRAMAPRLQAAAADALRRLGARDVRAAERRRVRQRVTDKLLESQ